jgi:hypothetical protein
VTLRLRRGPIVVAVALVAMVAAVLSYVQGGGSPFETLLASVAGGLAASVGLLALSLPGLSWRGLALGGFFVGAGIASWTYMQRPLVVWAMLGVEGLVFAAMAVPWLLRSWRSLPSAVVGPVGRLGSAWLGLAYWAIGVAGAVLALRLGVAAQRVAYLGVFSLAVLAVVASVRRRRSPDLSAGIAAAFLFAIALLLFAGAGNLFGEVHPVPPGPWGTGMMHRFWGGTWLLYHPNSLALIAVVVAIRIGVDGVLAAWQRFAAVGLGAFLVYLTGSRTAFGYAALAAVLHGWLAWRRSRGVSYATVRSLWIAIATPFVALALVLAVSGGQGFLFASRYGGDDLTSGRTATWAQTFDEFRSAGVVEKMFGDTKTSRAVVVRDGNKLTTDNALVGALRRGGVLGVLAFFIGLALLVWHAVVGVRGGPGGRRAPPAWLTITVLGAVPTIATADWLLGGTGGTLWILLVEGEAAVLTVLRANADSTTEINRRAQPLFTRTRRP